MKAVFLDRDGVINEDFGYVSARENFIFKEGIFEALRGFMKLGYALFVVTNQSGIARGFYTQEQFLTLNSWMLGEFEKQGVFVKKVYFCPHSPQQSCECRKPKSGMILAAKREFGVDLKRSILVGDKLSDIEAGLNAGVGRNFLISPQEGQESCGAQIADLSKSNLVLTKLEFRQIPSVLALFQLIANEG